MPSGIKLIASVRHKRPTSRQQGWEDKIREAALVKAQTSEPDKDRISFSRCESQQAQEQKERKVISPF